MRLKWRYLIICSALLSILCCEYLADFVVLWKCGYKSLPNEYDNNQNVLHAMILADTHLLGPIRGHWLDKLYREWHMHRAFQAANTLFKPDVIFILGDLFDEGDIIDPKQFDEHVRRFRRHFYTKSNTKVISAVGNHDIGFHYRLHPFFTERFEKQFNNTGVQLYSFKDIHFVFINSMAMENDGCYFCENALRELKKTSAQLDCLRLGNCENESFQQKHGEYSAPILMQHFPTYRRSDKVCIESDAPVIERYRENWEVLSKKSTDLLGTLLRPRLAFAGHSHHYCMNINRIGVEEYTVASFSWRNKINPSFLLAKFSTTQHSISKCNMLSQNAVIGIYFIMIVIWCAIVSAACGRWYRRKFKK